MEGRIVILLSLGLLSFISSDIVAAEKCSLDNLPTWMASCANIALFLNDTINSQSEICRIYSESVYCMKHNAIAHGLVCSESDIVHATKYVLATARANFNICNVTQEQGTVCSPDRLGHFALVTCRPLLAQQVDFGATGCTLSQYFLDCVNNQLKFAGTKCSPMEVQIALDSPTSVSWLHTNYPTLNMAKCFFNSGSGTNECADPITVLASNPAAAKCVGTFSAMDIVADSTMTDAEICGVQQELIYCVQRAVAANGRTCTVDQITTMMVAYDSLDFGIALNTSNLKTCQVGATKMNSSICTDDQRLSNYIAVMSHLYLTIVPAHLTADFCKSVSIDVHDKLAIIGESCTASEIFTVLTSPVGRTRVSRYTIVDFTPCLTMGQ